MLGNAWAVIDLVSISPRGVCGAVFNREAVAEQSPGKRKRRLG